MMEPKELVREIRRQLPKTSRFQAHATEIAWLVAEGQVEKVEGYLAAMGTDWSMTSKHFNGDRFRAFAREMVALAKEVKAQEIRRVMELEEEDTD